MPSDSEEEESEDEMLANPNHSKAARNQTKAPPPDVEEVTKGVKKLATTSTAGMSRKERESMEAQQAKERYRKLHEAGKTDEAKADLARLALIREKRAAEAARKQVRTLQSHGLRTKMLTIIARPRRKNARLRNPRRRHRSRPGRQRSARLLLASLQQGRRGRVNKAACCCVGMHANIYCHRHYGLAFVTIPRVITLQTYEDLVATGTLPNGMYSFSFETIIFDVTGIWSTSVCIIDRVASLLFDTPYVRAIYVFHISRCSRSYLVSNSSRVIPVNVTLDNEALPLSNAAKFTPNLIVRAVASYGYFGPASHPLPIESIHYGTNYPPAPVTANRRPALETCGPNS
jgi:hypothetical protein